MSGQLHVRQKHPTKYENRTFNENYLLTANNNTLKRILIKFYCIRYFSMKISKILISFLSGKNNNFFVIIIFIYSPLYLDNYFFDYEKHLICYIHKGFDIHYTLT